GSVTFDSGSTFNVELNGTGAGQFDQLSVIGSVTLGNAALSVSVGFSPSAGGVFTIINNDSNHPVIGTFAGFRQGAVLTAGGRNFLISYIGGDGNDVTLTDVEADLSISKSAPATATAGTTFPYTVTVTNNGPDTAQNVTLNDPLPAGIS